MLAVNYLNKSFGGLQANQNINFEVAEGEILGVIGPNGAGKSTLFEGLKSQTAEMFFSLGNRSSA